MTGKATILIFDEDLARRAWISRILNHYDVHAEPCEDVHDYHLDFPSRGVILVHDQGGTVGRLAKILEDRANWLPIIAYDENPELSKVVSAMHDGAVDYYAWPFDIERFVESLAYLPERFAKKRELRLREQRARLLWSNLTNREKEVLEGISLGRTSTDIGSKLSISRKTVEIHRANAIKKIGAKRTADAIRVLVEAKSAESST